MELLCSLSSCNGSYPMAVPPHGRRGCPTSRGIAVSSSCSFSSRTRLWLLLPGGRGTKTAPRRQQVAVIAGFLPVDPWSPNIDSQSVASQLFAVSLIPYLGFLYHMTRSKTAPKLTLFGFYFLLVFVGATIPAGIYAKVHYGTSLSNVDWLHGGAEFFLTLTNLFIVIGLRQALRTAQSKTGESKVEEKDAVGSTK